MNRPLQRACFICCVASALDTVQQLPLLLPPPPL
jgi:hypothetical protein